jgi:ion channel-forming bestrophin family protein
MMNFGHLLLVVLTAFAASASGFVSPSQVGRVSTSLHGNTKEPPPLPEIKDIFYGEESRRYRRTVYTHDDWRRHRSPNRFQYYLRNIFQSGIYKNLSRAVTATTAVAAFIVLFNSVVGGYTDYKGVKHAAVFASAWLPKLGLPLAPFTLSAPSLGLLLGTQACLFDGAM